ncbi:MULTISPECIES: DUF6552 family protein [unclassified Sulfitobacter]|uniref:DUF6552 family protein n=1 Tax=unclassified Sulfitobacter TaxID=196795 RepID=UPI0007C3BC06|nr:MULTISPECIES: DUF6552 family protein [unclassified Sulfitobacter]KZY04733.1 ubiquinone biosynthesis methyltransferase UbiE [Sulfitobacter sp. HI0023]KZY26536.1 ubiquinone biosynthesis methyltransferase UbiE [Sulfitobacter sp. HI0040]KZZ66637.1 ubiquinone biosynthesis methyltransferase UbiE [Sulfitobacter sp. HI0129]
MASECTNLRPHSQTAFVVKWAASVIQMLGYAGTGFGWTPWNLYLFLAGVLGWLVVGVLWNDRAIMLIHFVALGAMLLGMASQ